MRKKLLSLLVLLMTAVTGAWAVTWEGTDLQGIAVCKGYNMGVTTESMTVDGITIKANKGYLLNAQLGVTLNSGAANGVVFSAENNIKSITITSTGFSQFTPDGDLQMSGGSHTYEVSPAATSYEFANGVNITGITKIEITLEGAAAPAVTLTDGNDLSGLSAYAGQTVDVTYSRSFTSGKTSTVCLPFAYAKQEGDGSFYAFTNIEQVGSEYVATMTEPAATTLTANTPYLFTPAATGDVTFTGTIASVPVTFTAGETTSNGWTFKGTYETVSWTDAPTGIYGFSAQDVNEQGISQGEFVKVGEYVRVKPMRCYLENASFAGARGMTRAAAEPLPETIKVRLVGANGSITGIGTLQTKTGEVTLDGEAWYSLDGRRIEGKPSTKGIYVNNGKKVIINK